MGDVHQNQLTPESPNMSSSTSAQYSKAYSSFSPVMTSVNVVDPAQKEKERRQKEYHAKRISEVDDLLLDIQKIENRMAARAELNDDRWLVSWLVELTRGVELESYGFKKVLDQAKAQLLRAKESGDDDKMLVAVYRNGKFVELASNYIDIYIENMDEGAQNWVVGLNLTKSISFATLSAMLTYGMGGTVGAGVLAGAGTAALDNTVTEISMGFNGMSEGLSSAMANIVKKTISGGAFGLVGGMVGKIPYLSKLLGAGNAFVNVVANTGVNYGLGLVESEMWNSLEGVAEQVAKPESLDVDFDISITAAFLTYQLQKRAAFVDPKSAFHKGNNGGGFFYNKHNPDSDAEAFVKRANSKGDKVLELYNEVQRKVLALNARLNAIVQELQQYEDAIDMASRGRILRYDNYSKKYENNTITKEKNEDMARAVGYRHFRGGTYKGKDMVPQEFYERVEKNTNDMNRRVVPLTKELVGDYISLYLNISALATFDFYEANYDAGLTI